MTTAYPGVQPVPGSRQIAIAVFFALVAAGCGSESSSDGADGGSGSSGASGSSGSHAIGGATGTGGSGTTGGEGGEASGGTSGSGGSTGGGGSGSDGPSLCDDSDTLLCEGFEGPIDSALWTTSLNNGGGVEIDTTRAARGESSLKVQITGEAASRATLTVESIFPVPGERVYVRLFIFAESQFPSADFLTIHGDSDLPLVSMSLEGDGSFEPLYKSSSTEDSTFAEAPPVLATGAWQCLEWGLLGDTDELEAFLNGEPVPQIAVDSSAGWSVPSYASFALGLELFHEDPDAPASFDVWFDEVAFGETRLGCDL